MQNKLLQLKTEALLAIKSAKDKIGLEELEVKLLGRKNGQLTEIIKNFKDLSDDMKKTVGQAVNEVKKTIEDALEARRREFSSDEWEKAIQKEKVDVSQPALPPKERGHLHPITIVQKELEELFTSMGFMVLDGPELESDYYNFEGLNIPKTHPARDMQDTFYIKDHSDWVMRTQTSPLQVRAMQKYGAPLRVVVPGRCYRNEATDAAHEHTFDQLEGFVVDRKITIADLIGVMKALLKGVLKKDVEVRLRPGYFPFVEPGFELDLKCLVCGGAGCGACKHSGWIEILPCGLIHPNVFEAGGLNPKEWSGFAFGLGMTRLVMQKYGIEDIRLLQGGNLKFIEQF